MKDIPIWFGEVNEVGTNIRLYLPEKYEIWKHQLKGKKIELVLREYKAIRSPNQNSYLHYVLGKIAEETGHTLEEIKSHYKQKYASKVDEHGIHFLEKTSRMTTDRCSRFTEDILLDAAELGIQIKTPEEFARTQEL